MPQVIDGAGRSKEGSHLQHMSRMVSKLLRCSK
jgi:hypothetical protein